MIRALCAKSLADAKWLLAAFLALMFFLPWIYIWVTSMIDMPALSQFLLNALPKQWERMSGVSFSQIATPAGRIAFVYTHPLILIGATVWAIARGSDCVGGEIGRGTMEMLLAQPVRRTTLFATQSLVTIAGSALLATAAWCGTVTGISVIELSEHVSATVFIPPALNLFGLMVCVGGVSALASSWESQRRRTVGVVGAWFALSMVLDIASRVDDRWNWIAYASFFYAFKPQTMVAESEMAWHLFEYQNGAVTGIGLAGLQIILIAVGLLCYTAGAIVFNRREIPAPI